MDALWILAGLVIGGAAGYYIASLKNASRAAAEAAALTASLTEVRQQLAERDDELTALRKASNQREVSAAEAEARLESARHHFDEQRKQISEMETKLKDTFTALSSSALKSNNRAFTELADEKLKPLRDQLSRYEKAVLDIEKSRSEAYGTLHQQLKRIEEGRVQLTSETQRLVAALRQPGAKGKWGEVGLRNVVEMTGLSPYCDFEEQFAVGDEVRGRQRPDMVVRLPSGGQLVIDAKVNTESYLEAVEATDEEVRKRHLTKYAADVRRTMTALSKKDYTSQFGTNLEFVIMFMPSEAFFAAAVAEDKLLISDAIKTRVLIASPSSLAAMLMAVRHGWQQQEVAENARHIADAGRELYDRLCTFAKHFDDVRGGIHKAVEAYNKSVRSWESRAMPSARKLEDLGAKQAKELPAFSTIDTPLQPAPRNDEASEDSETPTDRLFDAGQGENANDEGEDWDGASKRAG